MLWTRLASPPTKNQRSGHAEMAMRHNWLVVVVYLGPSAHIAREQLGAEQTGSPPLTKTQRSGHAEMAMRHNWLITVVYLGPSAHITREQLGAEQTGQAPHLKQSSLLAASAKNSVRKLLDRTPHLHCASTNSQTWTTRSSSQRCMGQ